jgi:hypothetical protein
MATMTTKETGGLAPLMTPVSFSAPECAMPPEQLESFLADAGVPLFRSALRSAPCRRSSWSPSWPMPE